MAAIGRHRVRTIRLIHHMVCATAIAAALLVISPNAFCAPTSFDRAETAYRANQFSVARPLFIEVAKNGDAIAEFRLGTMFAKGQGVPQDFALAAEWLAKSAARGYAPAQNSLGVRYEKGQGVPQNIPRAAVLYREAAEQRFGLAQANLADLHAKGLGVAEDKVLAAVWWTLAVANGETQAKTKLAAVEKGFTKPQLAEARALTGTMFLRARTVALDAARGATLLAQAAEDGHVIAQFEYAECLDKGVGVTKSAAGAAKWYEKAAMQGHVRAQSAIAYLYDVGQGVDRDPNRAREWYMKAAEQGDAVAQYNLGSMFESGRGVPTNHIDAHMWFNIAEVNGNKAASESRRLVEKLMSPSDIAESQKRAAAWLKQYPSPNVKP